MPERLGAMVPHPFPTPLASFTCGPTKGMYTSPSPATSHHCLRQSFSTKAYQLPNFPYLLPPTSRSSALDEAFGIQAFGVL